MKTGPRLAALFALLVSWLNSRLDSLVVAMKAVLNVETYLHCSQDLRGTQHGLWPGLSPNLHLHVETEELEPLQSSFLSHSSALTKSNQRHRGGTVSGRAWLNASSLCGLPGTIVHLNCKLLE